MADDQVENRHFPFGPKFGFLLALCAFGVIFFAGVLGEGYWATVMLETGVSVLIYLLLGLALTLQWHKPPYYRLFVASGLASAVGLLVAGGFAGSGYWRDLAISLGIGLVLATALEFSLRNVWTAFRVEQIQEAFESPPTVMPEPSPLPVKRFIAKPPGTTVVKFIGGPWNGREETPASLRDLSRPDTATMPISPLGGATADMSPSLPSRSGSFAPPERIPVPFTVRSDWARLVGTGLNIGNPGYYKLQLSATTDDVCVYEWQGTTPPPVPPSHPKGLRLWTQRLDR